MTQGPFIFNTFLCVLHRIVYIIYKKVQKKQRCGTTVPVPYKGLN
jgi:hypothetical protein